MFCFILNFSRYNSIAEQSSSVLIREKINKPKSHWNCFLRRSDCVAEDAEPLVRFATPTRYQNISHHVISVGPEGLLQSHKCFLCVFFSLSVVWHTYTCGFLMRFLISHMLPIKYFLMLMLILYILLGQKKSDTHNRLHLTHLGVGGCCSTSPTRGLSEGDVSVWNVLSTNCDFSYMHGTLIRIGQWKLS